MMKTLMSWKSGVTVCAVAACLSRPCVLFPGCSSDGSATTRPTMDARADNAIRDPMHYSPFGGKPDMGSGGDHLEHRTLQQDVNDVIHP